jgi:hypothetical protein
MEVLMSNPEDDYSALTGDARSHALLDTADRTGSRTPPMQHSAILKSASGRGTEFAQTKKGDGWGKTSPRSSPGVRNINDGEWKNHRQIVEQTLFEIPTV